MNLKNYKISVTGLGYVGLPVALTFSEKFHVIGFDTDTNRIEQLQSGYDYTNEINKEELRNSNIKFTNDICDLAQANFHIVAVPTPIDSNNKPDLSLLHNASSNLGEYIKKNDIVVYESTVYPGATEEECIPLLEKASELKSNNDFFVGYSPERINPGDTEHQFSKIEKVVSAQNEETAQIIAKVYGSVIEVKVHIAPNIKVAEAAKIIENTQRDLNIALINELALLFKSMDIDTGDVLNAAGTKWNFLKFSPGLVGGHCIGVDSYYLTHKAAAVGYNPQLILAGRDINNAIPEFIVTSTIKQLVKMKVEISKANIVILGLSFKENIPDIRNSKSIDLIKEFQKYGFIPQVHDPVVNPEHAMRELNIQLTALEELNPADALVLAVPHREYLRREWELVKPLIKGRQSVVVDIKSILPRETTPENVYLWRL